MGSLSESFYSLERRRLHSDDHKIEVTVDYSYVHALVGGDGKRALSLAADPAHVRISLMVVGSV
jgi:hypothetical protein